MNLHDHYLEDGEPIKCWKCGSDAIRTANRSNLAVLDNGDGPVLEYECRCAGCNELVGYWAYGYFDPSFMQNPVFDGEL